VEGVTAALLLVAGGTASLDALQTASIATAVPFSIVLVLACVSMLKSFRYDLATSARYIHVTTPGSTNGDGTVLAAGGAGTASTASPDRPEPSVPNRKWEGRRVSTTLAGLAPPESELPSASDDSVVVRVHEVPVDALEVDPETGEYNVNRDAGPSDPLRGEVFDTPEFAESAIGTQMRA